MMRRHSIYMLFVAVLPAVVPVKVGAQWRPPTRAEIEAAGAEAESAALEARGEAGEERSGTVNDRGQNTEKVGFDLTGFDNARPFGGERRSEQGDYFYSAGYIPTVALMLPLDGATASGNDFTEFYKGALLALEDLKTNGRSLNVNLYNTARSAEKVFETVISADFADTDLIIGPVYEDEMGPAVQYSDVFGIPIVSPLAAVRRLDGGMLYRMAPDPSAKYDKLRDIFDDPGGDRNIILVSSETGGDAEFEREIVAELGVRNYGRFTIPETTANNRGGRGYIATHFASLIDWERENVFVVLAGTELAVEKALATISTSYNNASARRDRKTGITVVGSSKWASYDNLDKNLFFKLNVQFVTSYYIHRSSMAQARFEKHYPEVYGGHPTRAAYRGYDAVALFAGALFESGTSFDDRLARIPAAPLGTPYKFVQTDDGRRSRVNDQWTLVKFSDNFDIIVL